jgi:hypothetical protein
VGFAYLGSIVSQSKSGCMAIGNVETDPIVEDLGGAREDKFPPLLPYFSSSLFLFLSSFSIYTSFLASSWQSIRFN